MDRNTADGLRVFQGFSWGSVGTLGTLAAVVFTAGIAYATVTQRLDAVEGAAMGALIPPATLLNIAMPLKLPVRTP